MTIKSAPPYTDLDIECLRVGLWEPIKPADDRRRVSQAQGMGLFRRWGRAVR